MLVVRDGKTVFAAVCASVVRRNIGLVRSLFKHQPSLASHAEDDVLRAALFVHRDYASQSDSLVCPCMSVSSVF